MTFDEMDAVLARMHAEEKAVREAGHREYAHEGANTFGNFERIAKETGLSREQVLWVYARKHVDGIASWISGHRSQRESVSGRIKDLRMYLALLQGMIDEASEKELLEDTRDMFVDAGVAV